MESLVVLTIIVIIGVGGFTYNSNRKAEQEARRLAEEEARRRRIEQEEAHQRTKEQEARLREVERQAALRDSIKSAFKVAVSAAIEATIIATGVPKYESGVVHIVASAIEAGGVAESPVASQQTRTGEIEAARHAAVTEAINRSSTNASDAARKAATLEPGERIRIIKDARVAAVKDTMATATKDALANLRANGESRKIKNVRANAINIDTLERISKVAHEIENERANKIHQVHISENERIEAIIDAIETKKETYASIASSMAASVRANAIKNIRKDMRNVTSRLIVTKAIEIVTQDANEQSEAAEGATVATIIAAIATNVIDRIEDAIEDAVALTCMRSGSIQDTVEPSIANAIEVSTQDVILELVEDARNSTSEEEYADENTDTFDELDVLVSQLNVPIHDYQLLPKLESPEGYVYLIKEIEYSDLYKIGRTNDPATRSSYVDLKTPGKTEIIAILKSDDDRRLESDLHATYGSNRKQGEWFELTDSQVLDICNL